MLPHISIVIPTFNRSRALARCLDSVANLDYPRERFDVVVVDDGGSSGLKRVIDHYSTLFQLSYLWQQNQGPATARNTGATHAQGDYLAFIDDDCALSSVWLREMARATATANQSLFGGHTANALEANIYSCASQTLIDFLYDYFLARNSPLRFFTSNNLMVSRESFLGIGGFHSGFSLAAAEDRELSYRWIAEGGELYFVPEAVVFHHHDMGFRSFCKQHFNYGRGALNFYRIVRGGNSNGISPQPFSFYYSMLRYPAIEKRSSIPGLTGLLIVSQLANLVGILWEFVIGTRTLRESRPRR